MRASYEVLAFPLIDMKLAAPVVTGRCLETVMSFHFENETDSMTQRGDTTGSLVVSLLNQLH